MDSDLNIYTPLRDTDTTVFYELKNLIKHNKLTSQTNGCKLVHAFISDKYDYCNATCGTVDGEMASAHSKCRNQSLYKYVKI